MLTILAGPTSERTSFPVHHARQAPVGGVQQGAADLVDEVVVRRRLADDPEIPLALQRARVGVGVEFGWGMRGFDGVRGGPGFDGRHWAPPVPAGRSAV